MPAPLRGPSRAAGTARRKRPGPPRQNRPAAPRSSAGKTGRQHPEARPLIEGEAGRAAQDPVVHVAGYLRADEHADAVGHEHEESLRLAAHGGCRLLVHVDLPGHEEEVVADAVEEDADGDEPEDRVRRGEREQCIAQRPRAHSDHQHALHAEPHEEERHEQHEDDLGHLTERLRRLDLRNAGVPQEDLGEVVVGSERDAQQQRGGDEDIERTVAELRQRVEPSDAA